MANTEKLRQAIKHFKFYSRPSDTNGSAPCTVHDINKVVDNLANLLNVFVDELEETD